MTDALRAPKTEEPEITETLAFVECHRPGVKLGDYHISVSQTVTTLAKASGAIADSEEFTNAYQFSIAVPRFELSPGEIHAQFPPANSRGDYVNVLPHIAFTRSTLPWEREIWAGESSGQVGEPPWLAVLVVHELEKQQGQVLPIKTLTLQDLQTQDSQGKIWYLDQNLEATVTETACKIWFPPFELEKAQRETDKVMVVDIRKDLLTAILPTVNELKYLAHVRQQKLQNLEENLSQEMLSNELSVVISNRLPSTQGSTSIYLISLEDRFNRDGQFNYKVECSDSDYIRLICLKTYDFSCLEPKYSFRGLLTHLDQQTLRLPPRNASDLLESYFAKGYVPLPHYFRKGDRKISWYHGPLIPWQNSAALDAISLTTKRPRVADQLLRYNQSTGLLDTAYAIAWELGRMLSLQDKRLSLRLFNWKQSCLQAERKKQQRRSDNYLRVDELTDESPVPPEIVDWFQQLSLLQGVPFNYLVPDYQMLPLESIRFFWVDPLWIDCLLDGAFSMGRVTAVDSVLASRMTALESRSDQPNRIGLKRDRPMTGVLLHSEVVAGFPDLRIAGYNLELTESNRVLTNLPSHAQCPILRTERISDTVLICLFEGEITAIDLSLKPEALHFGLALDESTDLSTAGSFYKNLKDQQGRELKQSKLKSIELDQKQLIINISKLAQAIQAQLKETQVLDPSQTLTAAQFALQIVEGIDKVRFTRKLGS